MKKVSLIKCLCRTKMCETENHSDTVIDLKERIDDQIFHDQVSQDNVYIIKDIDSADQSESTQSQHAINGHHVDIIKQRSLCEQNKHIIENEVINIDEETKSTVGKDPVKQSNNENDLQIQFSPSTPSIEHNHSDDKEALKASIELDRDDDEEKDEKKSKVVPIIKEQQNEEEKLTSMEKYYKKKLSTVAIDDNYKNDSNDNNLIPISAVDGINLEGKRRSSIRHLVAVLALTSIVLANMSRQTFQSSIVNMVRRNQTEQENSANDIEMIGFDDVYDWDSKKVSYLQAAFSWGYAPFMIFGGRLSELYGAKWVVFISGAGSALCCLMTPFLADTNVDLLLASRIIMGLSQTGVTPAMFALCARWLPPEESSIYLPLIKVGVNIGFSLGSQISGFLSWRMSFFVTGLIGALWSILWFVFITSDPSEHKMVNQLELDYIIDKIQEMNKGSKLSAGASRKKSPPWLNILTNRVVVVFMITKFSVKTVSETQSIALTDYFAAIHVEKKVNGLLTSLNFIIQALFTGLVAWLAKEMVCRKMFGMSKTGVRKLFQCICQFGCGLAFLLITLDNHNIKIIIGAMIIASVACMFGSGGEAIIPIDLSADYSASIMALANSFSNLSGTVVPLVKSCILGEDKPYYRWNYFWSLVGLTSIGSGILWLLFVEAERQDFSKPTIFCCGSLSSRTDNHDNNNNHNDHNNHNNLNNHNNHTNETNNYEMNTNIEDNHSVMADLGKAKVEQQPSEKDSKQIDPSIVIIVRL